MRITFTRLALAITILAVTIMSTDYFYGNKARADVFYDWEYNITNVYNISKITYEFTNLDANRANRWDLYTVDSDSGALLQSLGYRLLPVGTTTATVQFGGASLTTFDPTAILYPDNYVGPLAVVDINGTILGRHFVTTFPSYGDTSSDWFSSSGNTALNDKQVIGVPDISGFCQSPVYVEINSDGWQHTFKPCSVSTLAGTFTLLHYQIDPTYVGPSTDRIIFFQIPDAVPLLEIYIDDIIAFQSSPGWSGGFTQVQAYSFIILNTSGNTLPFVDNMLSFSSFVTGDNPTIAEFDTGVYNYSRNNGGWISDGESVWIVTDDPTLNEWTLTANVDSVGEAGQQTLTARAVTRNVWESYHGFQQVADVLAGFSDTTVYAFTQSRPHTYTVANLIATDVTAQWINRAAAINSGLATPAEMEFEVQAIYDIVDNVTFEELINTNIIDFGLDTPSGSAALLTILLLIGMAGVASFSALRANLFVYWVVWTGIGGAYIMGGFATTLVTAVFGVITIGMLIYIWLYAGREDYDTA
jgi:hypothetical protein